MGHMIELVVMWAACALDVGAVVGVAGFVVRAVGKQDWSNLEIVEGAFAIGAVMGFVVMLFLEVAVP